MTVNLLGLSRTELQDYFVSQGEKPFRAQQVLKWIHALGISDFNLMTDISKSLRTFLNENCVLDAPQIFSEHVASDETRKWLMQIPGGSLVETVYIPEVNRGTLCISSQVGCALNCTFCHTATQGFARNLTSAEIIGQLWQAKRRLAEIANTRLSTKITNVVMMGMGEPLLNFESVKSALSIMRDPLAYELPRRRVTVSTSGVVPGVYRLISETDTALAISLHAPNDELRNKLVPLNKKYDIKTLLAACREYTKQSPRHSVTMEYVMLRGVNDSIEHAKQLVAILRDVRCKVNLIPFNTFKTAQFTSTSKENIQKFSRYINSKGIVCTTRTTRGDDIDAACGQLAGSVQDRTKRSERHRNKFLAAQKVQKATEAVNA